MYSVRPSPSTSTEPSAVEATWIPAPEAAPAGAVGAAAGAADPPYPALPPQAVRPRAAIASTPRAGTARRRWFEVIMASSSDDRCGRSLVGTGPAAIRFDPAMHEVLSVPVEPQVRGVRSIDVAV